MRVGLVTTASYSGGVWRHILDLAAGLQAAGHETVIAIPHGAAAMRRDADGRGFEVAENTDDHLNVDVWHLHLHNTFEVRDLVLQLRQRARGRTPIVLTEHLPRVAASDSSLAWDPTLPPGIRKPGARYAKTLFKRSQYAAANAVIAVSAPSRNFLASRYHLRPSRITLVPNGIPVPATYPAPPPSDARLRIAIVGVLGWRKGHDVLFEATRYAKQDWVIRVVGDGPLNEELQELAGKRAGQPVEFLGRMSDSSSAIGSSDILCVPSRSEASPYVVLEAMALGRPVVASAVDGLLDLVEDRRTGRLVPPEDPEAVAAAIDALSTSEVRLRMGVAGYERLRTHFSLEQMVGKTIDVYCRTARRA
jgi:glycosyltransferase involved in cell wall biosynthesis